MLPKRLQISSILCVVLVSLTGAASQNSPPAAPATADAARWRAETEKVEKLLPSLADRGAALFFLARRYAQLGDLAKSLSLLKECIALDEGFDASEAPMLQPLHSNPEFQNLVEQVRRRYPPAHQAHVAYTVPEKDLFPEGLAVDPDKQVFYMGSMYRKKIVTITRSGEVFDFVKPGQYGLLPLGGIKVASEDHSVWAASDNGHESELVHFDSHGKLLERFSPPGTGPHVLNDLVLRHSREIYVTDTLAHQVYRFDQTTHSFTPMVLPRPLLYPNGIAFSGDENLLYVADILGVLRIDLENNTAREVDPGRHSTLSGIDGLYWYKGSLLGVQYGTGVYRVARWRLSSDGIRVASTEILEHGTPLVKSPTTGAVLGENFYFIANTGIENLKDDAIIDPSKLEPIHIAVVSLE